ncbi:MAG: sulfurtransferase [Burkholderiales bacterium]
MASAPFQDTLIFAEALAQRLVGPQAANALVLDCSFDLADTAAGRRAFLQSHIPGAQYLHLDDDLSGAKTGATGAFKGRHPLPDREAFAARLAALGASDDTQVIAYDNAGGMFAARLWWMLRWVGHGAAAVLDGGLAAWRAAGQPLAEGPGGTPVPSRFSLRAALVDTVSFDDLRAALGSPGGPLIVDARSADRFRGENETLDPVGGHIPGARNRSFRDNLAADGRFKPPAQLRAEFEAVLAEAAPARVVNLCGSGVTACHNLLAMAVAGLGVSTLYPGSWSEWCAQPGAPVATGTRTGG